VAAVIALTTVALFLFLGAKTALLRDVGAETNVPFQQRTFSLARTQMAWWTAIILVSYVFEWLALGGVPALSAQPLVLMGFYSVLGVTARGVDLSRRTQFPPTTPHFFRDLTSDEGGVAVHRVQMLIFTIVVGLMFLNQVITTCSMPRFDINTLLLLHRLQDYRSTTEARWFGNIGRGRRRRFQVGVFHRRRSPLISALRRRGLCNRTRIVAYRRWQMPAGSRISARSRRFQ
jgi:hypothetical protein